MIKIPNFEENLKRNFRNQKFKHIKRMDNNCHIPDLVHAFSYVEKGRLNLVL